jgi:hypothetical protein
VDEIGTNAVAITNKDIVAAARDVERGRKYAGQQGLNILTRAFRDVERGRKSAPGLQTYLVANWLSLMDVR